MSEATEFFIDELATPLGPLQIISDVKGAIRLVGWHEGEARYHGTLRRWHGDIVLTKKKNAFGHTKAMRDYFAGDIGILDTLPVASEGTDFQKKVWQTLRKIPGGQTWSYGQMAQHLGQPSATRAVGLANGSNPIGIVVPCHRVIGANGTLTGYGGGLPRKKWLLAHEAKHAPIGLFGKAAS
ncbi:MAG TPA: methylated-DNA--[protein]-cysteine S-methyltransferase [Rhizomicrobium sp.]|jgi:methylated-DNA-[protein]-cysteine S-methyltransferase|nr:methylated-DNA--[protein]-cysteine S-methyltransferase [Rhizomicrobium sp.]